MKEKTSKMKRRPNWLNPETTAENEVLPRYLKWAWTSRNLSLAINVLLMVQLTYYCTDILGMRATLVGTVLLFSKLFDGVTDVAVGFIIDRTKSKLGKARPYELCIVFVWLFTILLFSTPDFSVTGKAVYVFIFYTLINSVCATFLNGGDAVYLARSVRNEQNRVNVMSFSGTIVMFASIIVGILTPQLIATIGTTKAGWTTIALMMGIPLAIIGTLRFVFVKEVAGNTSKGKLQEKIPLKDSLVAVGKNKYILLLAVMILLVQLTTGIGSAVNNYYFKYVMGDIGLASVVSLGSLVTPFVLIIFPLFAKKIGTVNILRLGALASVIGYLVRIVGGTNMATLIVGSVVGGMGVIPMSMMINIYLIDCMDYGEWKTGVRVEGLISSVNAFCSKLASGFASGLVGMLMGLAGYDGNLAVQSTSAMASIQALFNYIPWVFMILFAVFTFIYKLDKILPKVKQDLAQRHVKRDVSPNTDR